MDENWYYAVLSEMTGVSISDEYELIHTMQELAKMKEEYVKVREAISSVRGKGYGVVTPDKSEIKLEEPMVIKQGSKYGCEDQSVSWGLFIRSGPILRQRSHRSWEVKSRQKT